MALVDFYDHSNDSEIFSLICIRDISDRRMIESNLRFSLTIFWQMVFDGTFASKCSFNSLSSLSKGVKAALSMMS